MRASIPARPRNLRSCSATYSPHLFSLAVGVPLLISPLDRPCRSLPFLVTRCFPSWPRLHPRHQPRHSLSWCLNWPPPPSCLSSASRFAWFSSPVDSVNAGMGLVPRRPAGPRYTPRAQSRVDEASCGSVAENSFDPLTFPTTAGRAEPWVILSLTISAHARRPRRQRCQLRRNPVAIPVLRVTEFLAMRTLPGSPRASTLKPPGSLRVIPFVLSLDRRPDSLERCPVARAISSDRLTRARNLDIPNPNSSKAKKSPPEQEKAILRFLFRFVIVERFTPRQRSRLPT